ncbi:hypothetical protein CDAR_491251 [Caerostris darwini]|uniref:BHLH domain-containing protein n=1 Tax=Caerostris darwini TaxID=1538125 RepID=A0AAV4XAB6_9ARAC|nr:hypothetical protein CDAR_491251 [Caerostris darwini]
MATFDLLTLYRLRLRSNFKAASQVKSSFINLNMSKNNDKSWRIECNQMERSRRENVRDSFNQLRKCITKNIPTEKGESSQEHFQYMETSERV